MANSMDKTRQGLNDTLARLGAALDSDHRAAVDHDVCTICRVKAELAPDPTHMPEPAQVPAARSWLDGRRQAGGAPPVRRAGSR